MEHKVKSKQGLGNYGFFGHIYFLLLFKLIGNCMSKWFLKTEFLLL